MAKFEVFPSSGQYYFRFRADNGEQILSSESYTSKQNCINGVWAVKSRAPYDGAYQRIDNINNYRFNIIAGNFEKIAKSSEGYTTAYWRNYAIEIVKKQAPDAPVYDLT